MQTVQYARMPEPKKVTLADRTPSRGARDPGGAAGLAPGVSGRWGSDQLGAAGQIERAFGGNPTQSVQIVDFYHACEHLKGGCDAIYRGESTPDSHAQFARLRTLLKEADQGAKRIIRTLRYHRGRATGARQKRIRAALTYFRHQRDRMQYAATNASTSPLGVGWWRPPVKPWSPNASKAPAWPGRQPAAKPS